MDDIVQLLFGFLLALQLAEREGSSYRRCVAILIVVVVVVVVDDGLLCGVAPIERHHMAAAPVQGASLPSGPPLYPFPRGAFKRHQHNSTK